MAARKKAGRRTIAVDENTYRELIKAKARIELQEEDDLSIGEAISALVVGGLAAYGALKLWEEYNKNKGKGGF